MTMAKFKLLLGVVFAAFVLAACNSEGMGDASRPVGTLMSFTPIGEQPIVAAPDEEVTYNCTINYSNGLTSAEVSLDGEVLESSLKTWENSPVEVEYSFKYLVKGNQFGQTLDFVITATGADGYRQSVDYPLWITSNDVDFVISLPDNIPSGIYSNDTVEFEIIATCGNILKSFVVTKNGETFTSKTDFTTEKSYTHNFIYVPTADDINNTIEFHFVATDVKGNVSEAYYTVTVTKADIIGKELYTEIFDTSMKINGTEAYDTTVGGITSGQATEFKPGTIVNYNTLYIPDPENPEGPPIAKQGAMEGCTVYDGDLSVIKYSSDGVDVCLCKYTVKREEISGTHLWYRKSTNGWFRVDGIKLHDATSLRLSYSQSITNGKVKAEYSIDNGTTWVELIATDKPAKQHDKKFTVSSEAETISIRFTENGGSAHVCVDNIKLVEIL